MSTHHTFLFFGRSGCGKGTQAKLVQQKLEADGREVLYIETGAELRQFSREKNLTAAMTEETMNYGGFLPAFIPVWAWTDALIRRFDGTQDLILDGLCRQMSEAPVLHAALEFYGRTNVHIIVINVSLDWARQHLMSRARKDDTPDEIERRLQAYETNVIPVLEFFKHNDRYRYIEINGMQTIEEVSRDIQQAIVI